MDPTEQRPADRKFPNEEPGADMRQAAKAMRGVFVALVHEGFTENQALVIVGQMLIAGSQKPKD